MAASPSPRATLVAALAGITGCCPPPARSPAGADGDGFGAPRPLSAGLWRRVLKRNDGYRTRQEVHRVVIRHRDPNGAWRERSIRGLLAVSRPHRFRLAALSPLGRRLFDVLGDRRGITVIPHTKAAAPGLEQVGRSIGGDIVAIYRLDDRPPPPIQRPGERGAPTFLASWPRERSAVVVDARSLAITSARLRANRRRRIRYLERQQRSGVWIARRILVDNQPGRKRGPSYRLEIDVIAVELGPVLNPKLFELP